MRPRSRASDSSGPLGAAEAEALALAWLGARDLSAAQVRQRLLRRGAPQDVAQAVVAALVEKRAIDDARLARSAARLQTAVKGRGPARARAALRALGLADAVAESALREAFEDVDEHALLTRALDKRLGTARGPLPAPAVRRLVSALVRQGFAPGAVLAALRRRAVDVAGDADDALSDPD
ncbi:MAG: RecX family transcriptional regulator [Vicinamibacterales bacterium]